MSQSSRIGVYAGTFDPITNGHLDIVTRALRLVDSVSIAVADSTGKSTMFSTEERVALVSEALESLPTEHRSRISVLGFDGLLVSHVKSLGAQVIFRGLRAVSDYEYEAQMAHINRHLDEGIETVFLVTSKDCSFISSSIVKDIARNGGPVDRLVPAPVSKKLSEYYQSS